ncbi:TetR/AcrR family transcriptional regulator [Desulfatibacillum aliphaticivorans]|uniref:TetR/AcrR family transcriptional regulator n=1 Tax=Desulfatibacillum aliphaticivorans TaxID=218208 RepID=UPI00040FC943|nr:TetR/AcrR family transcriptional regulator [Desulfatibacillum aliphaticivorans]
MIEENVAKDPNKLTKRQEQAMITHRRIYETASQLIAEKGFDNVTVDEICKAAGVAKGGFYHHFPSKDDLVVETYRLIDGHFVNSMDSAPQPLPAKEGILWVAEFMATTAMSRGHSFCRQIYRSQLEKGTDFFVSPERPFYKQIRTFITQSLENGEIASPLPPDELTAIILLTARGVIYDWCLLRGSYNIVSFMQKTVGAILDGIWKSC